MTSNDVWNSILGSHKGQVLALALSVLLQVDEDEIRQGIRRIEQETGVGPLTNPTAYLDGTRFENAREYTAVLRAALTLRERLTLVTEKPAPITQSV